MPVTSGSALVQDPLLSNIGSRYRNTGFIADRVLTGVPIGARTFKYVEWDKVSFELHETQAVPKGAPNQIRLGGTKRSGEVETHHLADEIDPQEQEQAGGAIPLRAISTSTLVDGLMLRREKTVADKLTSTSTFGAGLNTTLAGADQWSHADSDPQKAVKARADGMIAKPNILVCGRAVASALITNPKVRDAFKGQALPRVTLQWLAEYLELEEIIVGESWYNTAAKGQAVTLARVWGKDALLAYRAPTPPDPLMQTPTVGYLPTLGGAMPGAYTGQGEMPVRVYTQRIGTRGTREGVEWIKAECDYKPLVVAPELGFLFKAAVG